MCWPHLPAANALTSNQSCQQVATKQTALDSSVPRYPWSSTVFYLCCAVFYPPLVVGETHSARKLASRKCAFLSSRRSASRRVGCGERTTCVLRGRRDGGFKTGAGAVARRSQRRDAVLDTEPTPDAGLRTDAAIISLVSY